MKGIVCLAIFSTYALASLTPSHAEPAMPDSIVRVGACATPGVAWGVFVQDTVAYVADRAALVMVNVADPSIPGILSSISGPPPIIDPTGVFVRDTIAYPNLGLHSYFATVCVADPANPFVAGWCDIPSPSPEPKGVCVADTFAYLAAADEGLVVVNIARPDSPTVVGVHNTPGISMDLSATDTIACVADGDSVQVIDVTNPALPFRVGACATPNSCYDVFVVDTLAYVACQSSIGSDGTLVIVSVSDPSNPFIVSSVTMNGDPWAVYISGNYAYVAAADHSPIEGGVRVVDISDPLSPVLVASYDTPGDPRDIFVVFPYIYVADYDSLQILRHVTTGVSEAHQRQQTLEFRLVQNQPNPFHGSTVISYSLPMATQVTLDIYDITGRLVETLANEKQEPGIHQVRWNRKSNPSGVYFYRLKACPERSPELGEGQSRRAGEFVETKKMVVVD